MSTVTITKDSVGYHATITNADGSDGWPGGQYINDPAEIAMIGVDNATLAAIILARAAQPKLATSPPTPVASQQVLSVSIDPTNVDTTVATYKTTMEQITQRIEAVIGKAQASLPVSIQVTLMSQVENAVEAAITAFQESQHS